MAAGGGSRLGSLAGVAARPAGKEGASVRGSQWGPESREEDMRSMLSTTTRMSENNPLVVESVAAKAVVSKRKKKKDRQRKSKEMALSLSVSTDVDGEASGNAESDEAEDGEGEVDDTAFTMVAGKKRKKAITAAAATERNTSLAAASGGRMGNPKGKHTGGNIDVSDDLEVQADDEVSPSDAHRKEKRVARPPTPQSPRMLTRSRSVEAVVPVVQMEQVVEPIVQATNTLHGVGAVQVPEVDEAGGAGNGVVGVAAEGVDGQPIVQATNTLHGIGAAPMPEVVEAGGVGNGVIGVAAEGVDGQPIVQATNTLPDKARCLDAGCLCYTHAYQHSTVHLICPYPNCPRHQAAQAFKSHNVLIKHVSSHLRDPEVVDDFNRRHHLKICSICFHGHKEETQDHRDCATHKASLNHVYQLMNHTKDDAFLDGITVDVMCELWVPSARKIKSHVARQMGMTTIVILQAIVRNANKHQEQVRWFKLFFLFNAWVLSTSGAVDSTTQASRIKLFLDGHFAQLHARLISIIEKWSQHHDNSDEKRRQRVKNLAGMGELGRAMRSLTSDSTVAELNAVNIATVKKLFLVPDLPADGEQLVNENGGGVPEGMAVIEGGADELQAAGAVVEQVAPVPPVPPPDPPSPPPPALRVTTEAVRLALKTAPRGAAGGRSGQRMDHLRFMVGCVPTLAEALTEVVNMAAECQIVPAIASYMFGGAATCFVKPNGGGLRPVVPQEALARLIGRSVSFNFRSEMCDAFKGVQVAMQPEGMAALATVVRANMNLHKPDGWVLQALDCSNAYNEIDRNAIKEGLRHLKLESFLKIHQQIYGQENDVLLLSPAGAVRLGVDHGTLQGDPLSAFFFCAGLQTVLMKLQAEASNGAAVLAYHDDVYLMGPLMETERLRLLYVEEAAGIGLRANGAKSVVACSSNATEPQAKAMVEASGSGAKVVSLEKEAMVVLGVPLGDTAKVRALLDAKSEQLDKDLQRVLWLDDMQTGLLLLSSCVVPRINHLLRTVPPSIIQPHAKRHDESIMATFASMLKPSVMHDMAKAQARLPIRNGGNSLFSAEETSRAAYLAALADTMRVANAMFPDLADGVREYLAMNEEMGDDVRVAVEHFNVLRMKEHEAMCAESPELMTIPPPTPHSVEKILEAPVKEQKRLRQLELRAKLASFKEMMSLDGRIPLYTSLQMQGAGAAYQALPSSGDMRMSSQELRVNTCRRLSVPTKLFPSTTTTCCQCGKKVDLDEDPLAMDYHAEICGKDGKVSRRHHAVQTCLQKIAAALGIVSLKNPVVKETPLLRGDLLFPGLLDTQGRAIVVDMNVTNVNQGNDGPNNPGRRPLGWSTHTTEQKVTKYQGACAAMGLGFSVFSIETTGAFGYAASEFLAVLMRNACILPEDAAATKKPHLMQQLMVVSVFQHNGAKLIGAGRAAHGLPPNLGNQDDELPLDANIYRQMHDL